MQRKGLRGMKRRGGSPSGLDCEDPAQPIAEKGSRSWLAEGEREREREREEKANSH